MIEEEFSVPLTLDLVGQFTNLIKDKGFISNFLKNLPSIKGHNRIESIRAISSSYESNKLILVLGAGVSMDYKLPDWYTLLQKLMIKTIEQEQKVSAVLSKLFTKIFNPTPLIAGRYLQNYFQNREESFEESVREALYQFGSL